MKSEVMLGRIALPTGPGWFARLGPDYVTGESELEAVSRMHGRLAVYKHRCLTIIYQLTAESFR